MCGVIPVPKGGANVSVRGWIDPSAPLRNLDIRVRPFADPDYLGAREVSSIVSVRHVGPDVIILSLDRLFPYVQARARVLLRRDEFTLPTSLQSRRRNELAAFVLFQTDFPIPNRRATRRLEDQLKRAVAAGATLVGGERSGNYFTAGVLTGVEPGNPAFHEELFGPIAIVFSVADENEAVSLANATPYGLGSYLFTTDAAQAERVADQIEAGMVFVNVVGADAPELPFGGVKRSGFGRELGRFGAEEFVNRKMIRIG